MVRAPNLLLAKLELVSRAFVAMYQTDPPRSPKEVLPTMYDLPSEDPEEPGLPDEFHIFQPQLLRETFCPSTYPGDQVFVASDLNLYYDPRHPMRYKRPDWFKVLYGDRPDARGKNVTMIGGISLQGFRSVFDLLRGNRRSCL